MKLKAYISSLRMAGGETIELKSDSITVVLGPNNSGKSTLLNDIHGVLKEHSYHAVILSEVKLTCVTPVSEVKEGFSRYDGYPENIRAPNHTFDLQIIEHWWGKGSTYVGYLSEFVVSNLTTRMRLFDCEPAEAFDVRAVGAILHPIQQMYRDDRLETKVSEVFKRAFGKDLVVHRAASQIIPLYVGHRPSFEEGENPTTLSYLERLERLEKLEKQGDGMVSFAALSMRVLADRKPILLIDEPEAFLHPPQARLVAEVISTSEDSSQVFIATHSAEVLQGLLANHSERTSFVRLSRTIEKTVAKHLDHEQIAQLWADPILRYSSVVEGIFHDAVIVAEADGDCRFYDAIESNTREEDFVLDLFYTHSGGKHRLPVIIKALRGLGVPVRTIVDFDVLNDVQPLKLILEAHGGCWTDIEKDWSALKHAVESQKTYLNGARFKREISEILVGVESDAIVDKKAISDVRNACNNTSPWADAKKNGLRGLPPGEPTRKASILLQFMRSLGIFINPVGEMEGFCPTVGGKSVKWVAEVLKRDVTTDRELQDARDFIGALRSSLQHEVHSS